LSGPFLFLPLRQKLLNSHQDSILTSIHSFIKMAKSKKASLLLFLIVVFAACQNKQSSFNIEQVNNKEARHIITPGMNSIGLIKDEKVYVYYLNESRIWVLDKVSQFDIPKPNDGLLSTGMGTIAVKRKDSLFFYNMDASLSWDGNYEITMPLPAKYKGLYAMKMPWQRGVIAIEQPAGIINFYYIDENKRWKTDEKARFIIPPGIEYYLMLGGMKIAIVSDRKLGVYKLDFDGQWAFQDDMVLTLPYNTEAVIPYEPGTIAVLVGNTLQFFEADFENRYWVLDDTMNFTIPD